MKDCVKMGLKTKELRSSIFLIFGTLHGFDEHFRKLSPLLMKKSVHGFSFFFRTWDTNRLVWPQASFLGKVLETSEPAQSLVWGTLLRRI